MERWQKEIIKQYNAAMAISFKVHKDALEHLDSGVVCDKDNKVIGAFIKARSEYLGTGDMATAYFGIVFYYKGTHIHPSTDKDWDYEVHLLNGAFIRATLRYKGEVSRTEADWLSYKHSVLNPTSRAYTEAEKLVNYAGDIVQYCDLKEESIQCVYINGITVINTSYKGEQ